MLFVRMCFICVMLFLFNVYCFVVIECTSWVVYLRSLCIGALYCCIHSLVFIVVCFCCVSCILYIVYFIVMYWRYSCACSTRNCYLFIFSRLFAWFVVLYCIVSFDAIVYYRVYVMYCRRCACYITTYLGSRVRFPPTERTSHPPLDSLAGGAPAI